VNHSKASHSGSNWIKSNHSFTLINPNLEVKLSKVAKDYGISFSAEFSKNVNSADDLKIEEDTIAYLLQVGFGSDKIAKGKDWQIKYARRLLEENAIPRGFGNTSAYNAEPHQGNEYFFGVGLVKNLVFNATFFQLTNTKGKLPQLVSQFDLIYKF